MLHSFQTNFRTKLAVSKKASAKEKGKRKLVESSDPKPSPPRTRRRTGGIRIQEPSSQDNPINLEEEQTQAQQQVDEPVEESQYQTPEFSPSQTDTSSKAKHGKSIPAKTKPSPLPSKTKATSRSSTPASKRSISQKKMVPPSKPKQTTPTSKMTEKTDSSSKKFRTQKDKIEFNKRFARKNYTRGKFLNYKFFEEEGFQFVSWLRSFGIFDFLSEKLMVYDELVKLFYFYLKEEEQDGVYIYSSYLRGKEIVFTAEDFAMIMKLPYVAADKTYDRKEVVECLTGKESLSNKKGGFTNKNFVSVEFKLVHHIVTHCLFPRNGGHDAVSIHECVLIYCIVYNLEYDLADAMLQYMFNQKDRANGHLPYAMYLTRLFQHFEIDLSNDVPTQPSSYQEINIGTLRRMRYIKHDDGKWRLISAVPGESEEEDLPDIQGLDTFGEDEEEDVEEEDGENDNGDGARSPDILGEEQVMGEEEGLQGKKGEDPQAGVDSAATVSDTQHTPAPSIPAPTSTVPKPTTTPHVTSTTSSLFDVSTLQALLAASIGSLKADLQAFIREQIHASTSPDPSVSTSKQDKPHSPPK